MLVAIIGGLAVGLSVRCPRGRRTGIRETGSASSRFIGVPKEHRNRGDREAPGPFETRMRCSQMGEGCGVVGAAESGALKVPGPGLGGRNVMSQFPPWPRPPPHCRILTANLHVAIASRDKPAPGDGSMSATRLFIGGSHRSCHHRFRCPGFDQLVHELRSSQIPPRGRRTYPNPCSILHVVQ